MRLADGFAILGRACGFLLSIAALQFGFSSLPPLSTPVDVAAQGDCFVIVGEGFRVPCTPTAIRPLIRLPSIEPTDTPVRRAIPPEAPPPAPAATSQGPGLIPVAPAPTVLVAPTATPAQAIPLVPNPTLRIAPRQTPGIIPRPELLQGLLGSGDLEPVRIEVLQSVSARFGTDDPEIPLVAGKHTLVRVYVQLTDVDEPMGASVTLSARRGGQDVGPCDDARPFKEVNPESANPLANALIALLVRDDLSRTFNFHISPDCSSWLASGNLTLSATVQAVLPSQQCNTCTHNDTIEKTVTFHSVRPLRVQPYIMTYSRPGSPNQGLAPSWSASGFDYLQSVYPVPSVEIRPPRYIATPPWINLDPDQVDLDIPGYTWMDPYEVLLNWFIDCCGSMSVDTNLGLLHGNVVDGGIAYYGSHALSGIGSGGTYAHEIGHNFHLLHSSNAHEIDGNSECEGGGCDPFWIYPHGGLTGHGWNYLRPGKLIVPAGAEGGGWHSHDTMSYGGCADSAPTYDGSSPWYCADWLSPLNHARIAQRLRCADPHWVSSISSSICRATQPPFINVIQAWTGQPTAADAERQNRTMASLALGPPVGSMRQAAQTTEDGEYLWVTARLMGDARAELRPFYRLLMPAGSGDHLGEGSYRIDLVDAAGNNLVSRNFEPARLSAHARIDRSVVDELVRWHPATSRIVLRRGAAVLAERQVSANPPGVTLISPNGGEQWAASGEETIRWTADDVDGDALFFWLEYSADGGQTWDTIERNVQGTSYSVDLRNLAGSAQAMVRVLATDGVHTAMDASDRAFVVARKAPLMSIMELDRERELRAGESLNLRGMGVDHEDGMLPGSALSWVSDLDGPLGTGETVAVRLSAGEHIITLTGRDSDGQEGTATLRLAVP